MNNVYYFISPSNNDDSCVYMTTDNHQDFTTLPPELGKTIIYFTSKKLAEKYIKNTKNDDELCVREIQSREVNRLEWICCYDYNIPFKINNFVGIILLGFFMSSIPAFFIWAVTGIDLAEIILLGVFMPSIPAFFIWAVVRYGVSLRKPDPGENN